jgi:hypothetical protein
MQHSSVPMLGEPLGVCAVVDEVRGGKSDESRNLRMISDPWVFQAHPPGPQEQPQGGNFGEGRGSCTCVSFHLMMNDRELRRPRRGTRRSNPSAFSLSLPSLVLGTERS